MNSELVGDATN